MVSEAGRVGFSGRFWAQPKYDHAAVFEFFCAEENEVRPFRSLDEAKEFVERVHHLMRLTGIPLSP